MASYSLIPVDVPVISTKYRSIRTRIPVPESLSLFESLKETEAGFMMGQPPIVWDRAEGATIHDRWGNSWIDWSSGVLIANAGHGRKEIAAALIEAIEKPLLSTFAFVHEKRAELCRMLQGLAPVPADYRVFLLCTGSEAVECALKLARTYAIENHGAERKYVVSFTNAFHGRTLGSQLAGGIPGQKEWVVGEGSTFIQVPFPDGYKNEDTSFELFEGTLNEKNIDPKDIAAVITESYQGVGPDFLPVEYARKLASFCKEHDTVMIYDEIQAGFGRTGRMFTYEHYGVKPGIIACGKGISSSLPISAVIGRADIMGLYAPGSMTSTHSGSPLSVIAAIENLKIIEKEHLVSRAAELEHILMPGLETICTRYPDRLGCLHGKGMVAGIQTVQSGTKTPDPVTAVAINLKCFQKGLLMFAPAGVAGECIKISPPLTIEIDALKESIEVFAEACDEVLG